MATKYNFYRAHQNHNPPPKIKDVKMISNHWGFTDEPTYEQIETYDLRKVGRMTVDELFDRYF